MPDLVKAAQAINQIGEAFDAYKTTNDEILAALKAGQTSLAAELGEKLKRIEATLDSGLAAKQQLELLSRVEGLEARASAPGKPGDGGKSEHVKIFENWLRRSSDHSAVDALTDFQRRDITVGSSAGGGYAVPEEISRQIGLLQQKFSPVRNLVKVVSIGTSDYKELLDIGGETSGWVAETGSRAATNTPTLREVVPTQGELYAYPQVSEWSLDDIFFNVEAWLTEAVARSFAKAEGTAVISGNGSSKPTGMLNTTPVTTADDAVSPRAAAAYQYINSGDNSPAAIDGDSLLDLVYTLNSAYRANGVFVMNSATVGAVRKLKDTYGQYLWAPSLALGQPDRLVGYPLTVWEQIPDIGGGNFPVGFGDWQQGYVMVDRVGLRITRDNVTNPGYVRFYIRKRVGGIVLNNDAVKWIRCL